jgi:hypothetical protein
VLRTVPALRETRVNAIAASSDWQQSNASACKASEAMWASETKVRQAPADKAKESCRFLRTEDGEQLGSGDNGDGPGFEVLSRQVQSLQKARGYQERWKSRIA